jgi:PAS domain S-box-containing protein
MRRRELHEAKIREERRAAVKALKESENLYRTIFENTGTAIVIINEDTIIALSNREVETLFGYTKNELEGKKSWTEIVAKEELDRLSEYHRLRRMNNQSAPRSYETKIIDKHGNVRHVYVNAALIPETKQTLVSLLDITDRIKTEEALRQSEERFRRLTEHAPDIIYRYRLVPTPCFEYINPIVTAITGYTPEEHYADPELGFKIVFSEDQNIIQNLHKNKELFKKPITLRWLHKDGKIIWTEQINIPVYDEHENLIAIEGIARDITKRKKMEDELKKRVKELEDFYGMAIGRELRMIELKEEIERLKEELKQYKENQ